MAYTTINKPSSYFNTVLYSGNGTNNRTITGVGFNPDMSWVKSRSNAVAHIVADIVRGTNKNIVPNETGAEFNPTTDVGSGGIGQVTTDGFTCVQGTSSLNNVNASGYTYVAWNWLAANSTTTNTSGTITSTVSANTTAGFSIAKYTGNATNGATVGHGLGVAPDMIIGKDLSDASSWGIWHKNLSGATYRLSFDTAAQSNDSALFGGSSAVLPTSTVFTLGSGGGLNGVNSNIVYCFTSIKGYSKFGSYTGNGSADGTFVYTGFKPAYVMVKVTSTLDDWNVIDNKRDPYNEGSELVLYPNLSSADTAATRFDMLSNGFKMRTSNVSCNSSGATYIYAAFAENPFVSATGIPATAR